jgi:hypothetical protein
MIDTVHTYRPDQVHTYSPDHSVELLAMRPIGDGWIVLGARLLNNLHPFATWYAVPHPYCAGKLALYSGSYCETLAEAETSYAQRDKYLYI